MSADGIANIGGANGISLNSMELDTQAMILLLARHDLLGEIAKNEMNGMSLNQELMRRIADELNAKRQEQAKENKTDSKRYRELQADIEKLKGELDFASNIGQRNMVQLNQSLNKYNESSTLCSNIVKSVSDTKSTLVNNIK